MSDATQPAARSVPLWVKILLGVSLALNLAVIGLVVGLAMRFSGDGPRVTNYGLPYVIALPKEDRRSIGKQLRASSRDGALPNRRARLAHYRDMLVLLEAETWDAEAADAILSAQATETGAVQAAARAAWLETIAGYSPGERAAYAERLRQVIKRGPGRKSRRQ